MWHSEIARVDRRIDVVQKSTKETLRAISDDVVVLQEKVDGLTETAARHSLILARHTRTLEAHTHTLAGLTKTQVEHTKTLAEHGASLAKQSETLDWHGELLLEILDRLPPRQ